MKHFLTFICMVWAVGMTASEIHYTPDDVTVFPNPERGFTDELGGDRILTDSKNHVVQPEESWYWKTTGGNSERKSQSLVMLMYYLKNYKTKDLSQAILTGFDEDMQILRNHGFKCVLRFAYDMNSGNDASLEWIQRHAAQLKPHLEANADVIYVLEAGFVGQWGEWYYSSHFGNETQHLNAGRRAVLDTVLGICPRDRFVLVRYPIIKTQYLGDENTLTPGEAHSGTIRSRIGHHNDAFLAGWGNDGTYGRDGKGPDDDPVLRNYIATETLYVPNGGETNVEEDAEAKKVYMNAETEMAAYHWSFCGAEYAQEVTNRWRTSGIFEVLNRRLGYRFQLQNGSFPNRAGIGESLSVSLSLVNKGFAPLYNARTVYLVLRSATHTYSLPMQADPRTWTAEAGTITINENLALPDSLEAGTYSLYLHLPDAYASLASDPRYSIRLANENMWDADSGMNNLSATIQLVPSSEMGLDQQAALPTIQKIEKEGVLYIIRGEHLFTAQGQRVY